MTLLATTIAGSLPKPAWLAEPGQLWAPWKLEGDALEQGKRDAVRLALFDQEHAGIDIVTDGEQTRRHFVTTFIEGLDGVDFANRKTVRIRNRYDADVPMVVGPVARRHPIYVDDARFVVGETTRPVKYTLPGPMTMVDTLYDGHYRSREKLALAFASILNEEARAIADAGVHTIQFDEPAFNVYFDEVRDWGMAALEMAAQGLSCKTAVHICYGYGIKANVDWKKTLGSEWRQYESTFPLLARSTLDQVSRVRQFPCAGGVVGLARREGRAGRGDRRRQRAGRNGRGRGRHPSRRPCLRAGRPDVPLHQLRHGSSAPGGVPRQAGRPRRRRGDRPPGTWGLKTGRISGAFHLRIGYSQTPGVGVCS